HAPARKDLRRDAEAKRALELAERARKSERRLVRVPVAPVDVASRDAGARLALEKPHELADRARVGERVRVEEVEVIGRRRRHESVANADVDAEGESSVLARL